MEQATDQALLERWVRDRDAEAFAEMVARHAGMVFATSRRVLGNRTEAEDVTQDCFLKLATANAPAFPFLAEWLHKVATHRSLDRLRQAKRRRAREERFARSQPTQTEPTWNDIEPYVDEAIAALPDEIRLLVVRHFLEGRSYSELAESLDIPRATLARRVQEGIVQVRELLKGRGILVAAAGLGALLTRNAVEAAPEALVAKLGKVALAGTGGLVAEAAPVTLKTAMWGGVLMGKKLVVAVVVVALGLGTIYTFRTPLAHGIRQIFGASTADTASGAPTASAIPAVRADFRPDSANAPSKETLPGAAKPSLNERPEKAPEGPSLAGLAENLYLTAKKLGAAKELKPYTSNDVPLDNGAHYFLLATELMPDTDYHWLSDMLEQVRANGWTDDPKLLALFQACQPALDAIRTGIEVGNAMMPPLRSVEEPLPYLEKFRSLGHVMDLEAQMYAARGDYSAALDEYAAMMDFGTETTRGSCCLGQVGGYAVCITAAEDLRRTLESGAATPAECRDIATHIMSLQSRQAPAGEILASEGDAMALWFQDKSANLAAFQATITKPEYGLDEATRNALASASPQQLQSMMDDTVQAIRSFASYASLPYYEYRNIDINCIVGDNLLAQSVFASGLERMPAHEARTDAQLYGTALVAALEAYKAENGGYPGSLGALAPGYLPQVPKDPFTGTSFHYVPGESSYRLYSAGPDMRDNGGVTGEKWGADGTDFVLHN